MNQSQIDRDRQRFFRLWHMFKSRHKGQLLPCGMAKVSVNRKDVRSALYELRAWYAN